MSGVQTPNLAPATDLDDVIGNRNGNTVRLPIARLAAIVGQQVGPTYTTRAGLFGDLAWPANTIATVWGDSAALNGTYRKTGAAGSGSWSRIGDLPQNPLTTEQLAAKADVTALANESNTRANATRDTGVIPLIGVGGTASAITASVAPAVGVALSAFSTVSLTPAADVPGATTLDVDNQGAWPILRRGGSALQAGDLRAGRSYQLRRMGSEWQLTSPVNSDIDARTRRVFCRSVGVSASEIVATLPAAMNPSFDGATVFDLLWPDAAWPVGQDVIIPLRIARPDGSTAFSETARLSDFAVGPSRGSIWSITPPPDSSPKRWREVAVTPSQKDVNERARAADVAARFSASHLATRQIPATRDPSAVSALRLVLPEEPSGSTIFTVVVPDDAALGGLSISTPTRTRTVGQATGASTPVAIRTRFSAGDVLTLQVHDTNWFRLLHWFPGGRMMADLQTEAAALRVEAETLRNSTFHVAEQVDNTLPARPGGARFVIWQTWADPTARMKVGDIWAKPSRSPGLPAIPSPAELAAIGFQGGPNGATTAIFRAAVDKQYPALQAIQYSVDGGTWTTLRAAPFVAGDAIPMPSLPLGDRATRFRYVNFLGVGEPSAERVIRAHGADFYDDFVAALSADGKLLSRDNWAVGIRANTGLPFAWTIGSSGQLRAAGERNTESSAATTFAGLSVMGGAGLFAEADIYREPASSDTARVGLSSGSFAMLNTAGDSAVFYAGGTSFGSAPLPTGHNNTARLRVEISPDGSELRGYLNGALVATTALAAPTTTFAPRVAYVAPSGPAKGDTYVTSFRAGKVAR